MKYNLRIVKKIIPYIASFLVGLAVKIFVFIVNIINFKKKKIFVYTDSRGFFAGCWYCKKTPLYSYILSLLKRYRVYYSVCPHKHTTLLDFLCDNKKFPLVDAIILHVGVVDFSPRPMSLAKKLREVKCKQVESALGKEALGLFELKRYIDVYYGEKTASLYSPEFLKSHILPAISSLGVPVVWVGVNQVLTSWRGSYFRERPENINMILEYQKIIDEFSRQEVIRLNLSDEAVKAYTVDNIHFSKRGFKYLYSKLIAKVDEIIQ